MPFSRYRGTSPIRKHTPLGPYRGPMPRVLGGCEVMRLLKWRRECIGAGSVITLHHEVSPEPRHSHLADDTKDAFSRGRDEIKDWMSRGTGVPTDKKTQPLSTLP